jgi:hypothetical protein
MVDFWTPWIVGPVDSWTRGLLDPWIISLDPQRIRRIGYARHEEPSALFLLPGTAVSLVLWVSLI